MTKFMITLALAVLSVTALPALADNPDANRCIKIQDIRETTTPDPHTILFKLHDGTVWRNSLRGPCSGLTWDGFTHKNFGPAEYCGNKEIIYANHTGAACMMGDFSREPPKPPRSHG